MISRTCNGLVQALALSVILPAAGACDDRPSLEEIAKVASDLGIAQVHPSMVKQEIIPLETVKVHAVRTTILARIPAVEIVFVAAGRGWTPVLINKELTTSWHAITPSIEINRPLSEPDAIARDLTRILLDPDPTYGIVLESAASIPRDYQSSDVRRDLVRSGKSEEDVRTLLLLPLGEVEIRAPAVEQVGAAALIFTTWHYFGGEVARWRIDLEPRVKISRETLATGVGSYDSFH